MAARTRLQRAATGRTTRWPPPGTASAPTTPPWRATTPPWRATTPPWRATKGTATGAVTSRRTPPGTAPRTRTGGGDGGLVPAPSTPPASARPTAGAHPGATHRERRPMSKDTPAHIGTGDADGPGTGTNGAVRTASPVAQALRELAPPRHGRTFWTDLDARLADEPQLRLSPRSAIRPITQPPPVVDDRNLAG